MICFEISKAIFILLENQNAMFNSNIRVSLFYSFIIVLFALIYFNFKNHDFHSASHYAGINLKKQKFVLCNLSIETKALKEIMKDGNKIIFEPFITSKRELTLLAWNGKRGKKTGEDDTTAYSKQQLLVVEDKISQPKLKNIGLIIGNLEGNRRRDANFFDFVDTTQFTYLIFKPDTVYNKNIGLYSLIFHVDAAYTNKGESLAAKRITTMNPSPPRAAY